jgi:hypothetical protein
VTNELEPGQTRFGYLVDGRAETPHQAASLTYEEGRGAVLTVPYILGEPQFAATETWFMRRQDMPETLIFWDSDGYVTLTGLHWGGHSFALAAKGRVVPTTVIFGRPRLFSPDYRVRQLGSRLDGLQAFSRFTSLELNDRAEDADAVVTLRPSEAVRWRHDGFSFAIRATVPWSGVYGQSFTATADSILESRCSKGRTVAEHVRAQWPLRALLILAFGSELSWRDHWVTDQKFPTWMLDGSTLHGHAMRVQTRRTVADFERSATKPSGYASALFHLQDLGSAGVKRWFRLYGDDVFRRAIEPLVEVINGASRFLEPQLLMTAMALEAMGHYRDAQRQPNRSVESQIKRCIDATGFDWSPIGSTRGIAGALAQAYNDLKHVDRGRRPDGFELSLLTPLAVIIMRLQLFDLLGLSKGARLRFTASGLHRVLEPFALNGVTISRNGELRGAT